MIYKQNKITENKGVMSSAKTYILLLIITFAGLVAQMALFGPASEPRLSADKEAQETGTYLEAPDIKVSVAPRETLDLASEKNKDSGAPAANRTPQNAPVQGSGLQQGTGSTGSSSGGGTKESTPNNTAATKNPDPKNTQTQKQQKASCKFRLLGLCVL